jgi:hypothetical protein
MVETPPGSPDATGRDGDETETPTVHIGVFVGVCKRDGQLASGRRNVTLIDHGTGAGGRALATVLLDGVEAEQLAPIAAESTHELVPLRLDVWPADDPGEVVLVDETRTPESRRVTLDHDWVADRLVKRFTHDRHAGTEPGPLLHGGAVADDRGAAVLVLGASGAGKSTLIAHLAAAGCELLNDEQISVHAAEQLVGGFARPIDIKPGGIDHLPPVEGPIVTRSGKGALIAARQLGARHRLSATPALVVLPTRADAHAVPRWEELHPAEALGELCANNLDLARGPVPALEAFAWLASTVRTCTLRYDDAAIAAGQVLARLRERPVPDPMPYEVIAPGQRRGSSDLVPPEDWRPSPQVATVHLGDRTVLYDGATRGVARLNQAGSDTWKGLLAGGSLDEDDHRLLADLAVLGFVVRRGDVSPARARGATPSEASQ